MATIRDIAKRARVSTATVSYVINQSRFVSKDLSDRVLEAVEQLEFTPSRAARSLRHGKTFTIGLLTGDVTHRFAGELINGLEEAALKQGYGVVISNLRDNPDREEQCIKTLLNLQVDGMVYAGFGAATGLLEKLQRGGLPIVVVDKPVVSKVLASVLIDNRASVFLLLDHLRQMGHRRILFINGLKINPNAQLRANAFQEYLHRHKLDISDVLFGDYTMRHGYQAACHALANHPGFTAVSCGDDTVACGVMAALKANGRRIPEDVAVAGFSDDPMAQLMDPPLTTVCYPIAEMGRAAFHLFRRLSTQEAKPGETITLETTLAIRHSTDIRCPRYPNLIQV